MKNAYLVATRRNAAMRLCAIMFALFGLALNSWAQTGSVSFTSNSPDPQDFGTVAIGQVSAARTYTLSGSGLSTSDNVVVSAAAPFQVSLSPSSGFAGSVQVAPATDGTVQQTLYIRFKPTTAGSFSVRTSVLAYDTNGDPLNALPRITLTGTGVSGTPSITVSPTSLGFGSQVVNTTSSPQTVTVEGTSLTAGITVTAPAGFLVSDGGAYASSLTLPQTNGSINTTISVVFKPTAAQSYVSNITFSTSGGTDKTVSVAGTGVLPTPVLSATPSTLPDFGSVQVGNQSAAQSFTVSGNNLQGNVSVAAPTGFLIRTGSNPFSSSPISLSPNNGTLANTTIDVVFAPNQAQSYTGSLSVTSQNASTATVQVSGTGTPAPAGPTITTSTTSVNFGTVTNSGSADTRTFTVGGTSLQGPLVLTPSNSNIQIRNASAGGSFAAGAISINPDNSGFVPATLIEVRLVPIVPQGTFNGSVILSSTGATNKSVTINANNPSGTTSDISLTNAVLREFGTSPGVPSAIQSYNLSASNLLQDLTITAPQFFQVALSNDPASPYFPGSTTANTIVLPRGANGNIALTTIYVRYYPPGAQTNRGTFIDNASAPALTQRVSVNGSSEPYIEFRDFFTQVRNQIKGTVSGSQMIRVRGARLSAPQRIQVPNDATSPLNPSGTPQFQLSTDGVNFSFQVTLTPNSRDSLADVPLYVRYAPTRVGSALADLQVVSPNFNNGNPYSPLPQSRVSGTSIDVEPTLQSNAQLVRSADGTSVTIKFLIPTDPEDAGYGENRLIIATAVPGRNTLSTSDFPQDAQPYDPGGQEFGRGSQISPGNYVVYAGSAPEAIITGLDPAVAYNFFGFEYNNDQVGGAENYKVPNLPTSSPVQGPLPVELVAFDAKLRSGKVFLTWTTAQEKNNRGFEVERSQNGTAFTSIGFKAGHGSTAQRHEYSHVDEAPLAGVSYYRLKQIDNNGTVNYSSVLTVKNGRTAEVAVYPNPVDDVLNIRLANAGSAARVTVTDLMGRTVLNGALSADGSLNMSSLKPGNYIVIVTDGTEKSTHKVTKR